MGGWGIAQRCPRRNTNWGFAAFSHQPPIRFLFFPTKSRAGSLPLATGEPNTVNLPRTAIVFLLLVHDAIADETLKVTPVRRDKEISAFAERFPELHKAVAWGIITPGLESDYVPQGVCWLDESRIALTYYDKSGKKRPSLLIVVDATAGRVLAQFRLLAVDGKPYTGHAGGVARHGNYLWIGSGGTVMRFAIAKAPLPGGDLTADFSFEADSTAAFVTVDGDYLWVGDFSYGKKYPTPKHHHHGEHKAWAVAYHLDPHSGIPTTTKRYRVGETTVLQPDRIMFLPQKAQGMAIFGDLVVVSMSYSYRDSKLAMYRLPKDGRPRLRMKAPDGELIDAWVLDQKNHIKTIPMPAGSEGIDHCRRGLVVGFEGGSKHYRGRWRFFGGQIEDRILVLDPGKLGVWNR